MKDAAAVSGDKKNQKCLYTIVYVCIYIYSVNIYIYIFDIYFFTHTDTHTHTYTYIYYIYILYICNVINTSSTAHGGSFKNPKPIEVVGCCESRTAERIH